MEKSEHYDAFISYRHLPKDEAIAKRLQVLLENYRPPRGLGVKQRINRVFLDRSELPTSQDLGQSLEDALLSSDYLIVILSEQTKESKWCMEEIRNFKKAHGGKTNRILPVLVSGEPGESLPEELCFEQVIEKAPDGSDILVQKEIEPLCCDVRGDNDAERLKKLKTEFLRIVAPMLGCGYDDLFQRHKRRQRRRLIISLSSVMMLFVVAISTLIYFNLKISASEQKYRANLMDSYVNTGNERAAEGKMQEALACYVKVLKDMPEHKKAKQGALLILQLFEWIYQEDSSSQVSFPEDDPIYGESHTVYLKNNPYAVSFPGEPPSFYDIERDMQIFASRDQGHLAFDILPRLQDGRVCLKNVLLPACSASLRGRISALRRSGVGGSWIAALWSHSSIPLRCLIAALRRRCGIRSLLSLHTLGALPGSAGIEVPDNLQGVQRLLGEVETLAVGFADTQLNEVGGPRLAGPGLTDKDIHVDRQHARLAVRPDIEARVLVIGDEATAHPLLHGVLKSIEVTQPDISDHVGFLFCHSCKKY